MHQVTRKLALSLAVSTHLFGAEMPKSNSDQKNTDLTEGSAASPSKNSRDNRSEKKSGIGLTSTTLFLGTGHAGGGIEGSSNLSNRYQINLSLVQGGFRETVDSSTSTVNGSIALKGTIVAGNFRHFTGNSFYYSGGLGLRKLDSEIVIKDDTANSITGTTSSNSIIAQFAIGNLWTLDSGVYLGGEWFSYQRVLASSFRSTTKTTGIMTTAQKELQQSGEDLAKSLGNSSTASLLTFIIGYQF